MTDSQRHHLRRTFENLVPLPQRFGLAFYDRLFALDPRLRALFRDDLDRQATMLVNALAMAVLSLLDERRASRAVHELGARHRAYGVRDEDYDTFGAALEQTFAERLGDDFSPELRAAWREAWGDLADAMRSKNASAGA